MGSSVERRRKRTSDERHQDSRRKLRRRAAIGVVGLAALGGGGAAVAASQVAGDSPAAQTQAIAADAAGQLGVTATARSRRPSSRRWSTRSRPRSPRARSRRRRRRRSRRASPRPTRRSSRSAAARAAGGGPRGGPGGGPISFDAAATYIGITASDLRTQLAAGKTLAAIADGQRQDRRRPQGGAHHGGEEGSRRRRHGRPADAGPGGQDPRSPAGPPRPRDQRGPHGQPGRRPRRPAALGPRHDTDGLTIAACPRSAQVGVRSARSGSDPHVAGLTPVVRPVQRSGRASELERLAGLERHDLDARASSRAAARNGSSGARR